MVGMDQKDSGADDEASSKGGASTLRSTSPSAEVKHEDWGASGQRAMAIRQAMLLQDPRPWCHCAAPPLRIKDIKPLLIFGCLSLKAGTRQSMEKGMFGLAESPQMGNNDRPPPVFSEEEPDLNSELEISVSPRPLIPRAMPLQTTETVEAIVGQLMEKQRTARSLGTMECACPDSTCLDSSSCVLHTTQPKPEPQPSGAGRARRLLHHRHLHESSNQVRQRAKAQK